MSEIKSRIIEFIEELKLEKNSFYKSVGIASSNFRGKSRQSEIGGEILLKIANQFPQLSIEWLVTGKGNMWKQKPKLQTFSEINQKNTDKMYPEISVNNLSEEKIATNILEIKQVKGIYILPNFDLIQPDFLIDSSRLWPKKENLSQLIWICKKLTNWNEFILNEILIITTNTNELFIGNYNKSSNKEVIKITNKQNNIDEVLLVNITSIIRVVGDICKY